MWLCSIFCIITVHKRSCRKLMFSQVCANHSVNGMRGVSQHSPGRKCVFQHVPEQEVVSTEGIVDRRVIPTTPSDHSWWLLKRAVRILLGCILVLISMYLERNMTFSIDRTETTIACFHTLCMQIPFTKLPQKSLMQFRPSLATCFSLVHRHYLPIEMSWYYKKW